MRVAGVSGSGLYGIVVAVEQDNGLPLAPVTGAEPNVVEVPVGLKALVVEKGFE